MQLLRENCFITTKDGTAQKLPITESSQLIESSSGKKYKAVAAYLVEISRYDVVNKNDRLYPKKLWEKVIKEQKDVYDGAAGLMDHPETAGSVKDIFCVWHNMRLREENGTVVAEMYLVGTNGQNAKDFLDAGGRLELSTSGFGDMSFDQQTVDADSYRIERPADWVFDCSQSVYAKPEDEIKESFIENISINECSLEEKNLKVEENTKETKMDKLTEATIKSCQAYAKSKLQEAHKEEVLMKKKELFKEVVSYCEGLDGFDSFIEEADQGISEIESKLVEAEEKVKELEPLKEKQEVLIEQAKTLGETNEDLKTRCEVAVSFLEQAKATMSSLKKERQILKELYEKSQKEKKEVIENAKIVVAYNESLDKKVKTLKNEMRLASIKEKNERLQLAKELSKILDEKKLEKLKEKKSSLEEKRNQRLLEEIKDLEESEKLEKDNSIEEKQKRLLEANGLSLAYFPEASSIREWYEDILSTNPEVADHELSLLSSITLQEAQNRYRVLVSGTSNSSIQPKSSKKIEERTFRPSEKDESPINSQSALDLAVTRTQTMYKGFK